MAFFQGFTLGAGIIIAIGAQNSFVLAQGIKRQHTLLIPIICSICDALLIATGVAGMGALIMAHPGFAAYMAMGGALFLFWYGLRSLVSALKNKSLSAVDTVVQSRNGIILTTLALTFLNPHVYIDTIVLIGSVGAQYDGISRLFFALGASFSSLCWFFLLSFGGTLIAPLFKNPSTWRVLDISICLVMWILAFSLWPDTLPFSVA